MCKFSSKSGGVPFQPLGDLTWNDPQGNKNNLLDLPVLLSHCVAFMTDLKKVLQGFEPATVGAQGNSYNHYTTGYFY